MSVVGGLPGFLFEGGSKALFHFRRRSFGERHNQNFLERQTFFADQFKAACNKGVRFARAGTGHDEDVASRCDGTLLRRRQGIFSARWSHFNLRFAVDDLLGWR
jgi:hypothetical protein